jgi:predicted transcriptional regulator
MTLRRIKEILRAEIICGQDRLDEEVKFAGGSDLMSDVLAFGKPGLVLLTGLSNAQSIRTATIIDASAVIYVRGKRPDAVGRRLAEEKGLPVLSTEFMMYKACGLLYSHGLPGISDFFQEQE